MSWMGVNGGMAHSLNPVPKGELLGEAHAGIAMIPTSVNRPGWPGSLWKLSMEENVDFVPKTQVLETVLQPLAMVKG